MDKSILIFAVAYMFPTTSYAYIGPGMGGGIIAITFGFLAAIFLAIFGILYFPIKRALKQRKDKKMTLKQSNDKT